MIEHGVDKVERQPLVQDAAFIAPSTDDSAGPAAQAALIAVYGTPNDGDVAVYIASSNRVEWRAQSTLATGEAVTVEDGAGGFEIVFDDDGNVVYA